MDMNAFPHRGSFPIKSAQTDRIRKGLTSADDHSYPDQLVSQSDSSWSGNGLGQKKALLDANRLISLIANRQSLSPTAQAALIAAVHRGAADQDGPDGQLNSGPSFNADIAQLLTEWKER
jgi:hypothetical protein